MRILDDPRDHTDRSSGRERVAERWGDEAVTATLGTIHWMASSVVRRHLNRLASGDPTVDWVTAIVPRALGTPDARVVVLGCGEGWLDRDLAARQGIGRVDATDLAVGAVVAAAARARQAGVRIGYFVADLDRLALPTGAFDLVVAHASLHHVDALASCLDAIAHGLRPEGRLLLNEYVGPDRFQFSQRQMELVNGVMVRLPPRLRRSHTSGVVFPHKDRPTVDQVVAADPSEAIHSAAILEAVRARFEVLEEIPYGGTILQHLLYDIVPNFRADDPVDSALLEVTCLLEERLLAGGAIPPDYMIVVARPRTGPRGETPPKRPAPPPPKPSSKRPPVRSGLLGARFGAAATGRRGLAHRPIRRHLHRLGSGDPDCPWRTRLVRRVEPGRRRRALLLGKIDPAELRAEARFETIDRRPGPGPYDLVISDGRLAFAPDPEAGARALARRLVPGGLFGAELYVGPADLRLTPAVAELEATLRIRLDTLLAAHSPGQRLRRTLRAGRRRCLESLARGRADGPRLLAALAAELEILELRPYGSGLLDRLVPDLLPSTSAGDPQTSDALLGLLAYLEEELLGEGLLEPRWVVVVARRRA